MALISHKTHIHPEINTSLKTDFCLFWWLLEKGLALFGRQTFNLLTACFLHLSTYIYSISYDLYKIHVILNFQPLKITTCLSQSLLYHSITNTAPCPPLRFPTSTCRTTVSTLSHSSYTSEPQRCQNYTPSRALTFYLIANMFNSWFTGAARRRKATWVCNLQSKSAQQKYSSSEDSGIQSFLKGKQPTLFFILRSCIVCKPSASTLRPRLIIFLQGAHFLELVVILSLRKEHSRQENWDCVTRSPSWGKDVWKSSPHSPWLAN